MNIGQAQVMPELEGLAGDWSVVMVQIALTEAVVKVEHKRLVVQEGEQEEEFLVGLVTQVLLV